MNLDTPSVLQSFTHFGPWQVGQASDQMTTACLDAVFCINLKERADRRERMIKWATDEQVPLQFLTVERHPQGGAKGCKESHLSLIRYAHEHQYDSVLILEDDIYTMRPLAELPRHLPMKEQWMFCFLGMIPIQSFDTSEPDWRKVSGWCAHAYVVHSTAFKMILENEHRFDTIDALYDHLAHTHRQTFLTKRFFLGQLPDKSDIDQRVKWTQKQWEDLDQNKQIYL